jgi:hypothetical protein
MVISGFKGGLTMSTTDWSLDIKIVKDGPVFKDRGHFEMEGYNRIDVVVPQGESLVVKVHSGELKDIQLLYIKRTDAPEVPKEGQEPPVRRLSYTFGSMDPIELSDVHVVLGTGAIKLLCETPDELCFNNEGEQDAHVTILVCRETSGPCEPVETKNGDKTGGEHKKDKGQYPPLQEPEQKGGYGEPPQQEPPPGHYPPRQEPEQSGGYGEPPQQEPPPGGREQTRS